MKLLVACAWLKLLGVNAALVTMLVLLGGFVSGVMASVLGIGGAAISTPVIRALGASAIHSVGSTVPAILPGALAGSARYSRAGLVDSRAVRIMGAVGLVFAVAGSWVADLVNARWLMVLTACLVGYSGVRLLVRQEQPSATLPSAPQGTGVSDQGLRDQQTLAPSLLLVGLGAVAGFLAGLLGVGGGIVITPGLITLCGFGTKRAVATSLATVAIISVAALVTHITLGHIDWRFALPLAIGIVPGARVGARFTLRADEVLIARLAGSAFIFISLLYAGRELIAL